MILEQVSRCATRFLLSTDYIQLGNTLAFKVWAKSGHCYADIMLKGFAAFFLFGATMCTLTIVLLLFPGTALDSLWRINPDARVAFQSIGKGAFLLMLSVGIACAFAALGLWRAKVWGIWLALVILALNIAGDLFNAFARHDYRALIGLPIGGAMIFYLVRAQNAPH